LVVSLILVAMPRQSFRRFDENAAEMI